MGTKVIQALCYFIMPVCVVVTLILIPLFFDHQLVMGSLFADLVIRLLIAVWLIGSYRSLPTLHTYQQEGFWVAGNWLSAEAQDDGLALRIAYFFGAIGFTVGAAIISWWSFTTLAPITGWWSFIYSIFQSIVVFALITSKYKTFRERVIQATRPANW